MSIVEFQNLMQDKIEKFSNEWISRNKDNAEQYPFELDSVNEWIEQFTFYLESMKEL